MNHFNHLTIDHLPAVKSYQNRQYEKNQSMKAMILYDNPALAAKVNGTLQGLANSDDISVR
jgi:hypothetical protein